MGLMDQLSQDAVNVFCTDFGETAQYMQWNNGQPVIINVNVIVNRNPLASIVELQGGTVYTFEVMIPNDPTVGITTVVKGQDKIILAVTYGGSTLNTYVVSNINNSAAGMWHLGVG
jgi:hypothetical protein